MQLQRIGDAAVNIDHVKAVVPGMDGKTVRIIFIDNEELHTHCDGAIETIQSLAPFAIAAYGNNS